jgi:uncharacterized BrkB/YihY/UPF0761 family membrane protein
LTIESLQRVALADQRIVEIIGHRPIDLADCDEVGISYLVDGHTEVIKCNADVLGCGFRNGRGFGFAYMALFALIPIFALLAIAVSAWVEDPFRREQVLGWIVKVLPMFEDVAGSAVRRGGRAAAIGGLVAFAGFSWAASGFYLNLTRATERFFPGKRKSGARTRVVGVVLVLLTIAAVIGAVTGMGIVNAVADGLDVDVDALVSITAVVLVVLVVTGLVYGVFRVLPANPPTARSARAPAVAAGLIIASSTLFYGLLSPWLVSSFETFGVMASVFVALVWLRLVFMAMIYGAAAARYRGQVALAVHLGHCSPHRAATQRLRSEEMARAKAELQASDRVTEVERAAAAERRADKSPESGRGRGQDAGR